MNKKELCGPCVSLQERVEFFGLGCIRKGLQLGEMFPELCGEGNCTHFLTKCGGENDE